MNYLFVNASFAHYFLFLYAVLFGIHFKVKVVQKTYDSPKIPVVAVAELVGIIHHCFFNRFGVLKVKRLLVVFRKERVCFVSCHIQTPFSLFCPVIRQIFYDFTCYYQPDYRRDKRIAAGDSASLRAFSRRIGRANAVLAATYRRILNWYKRLFL